MAEETLYFDDMAVNTNAVITDDTNVIDQYGVATCTIEQDAAGNWAGGGNMNETSNTPTGVSLAEVSFWNSGSALVDDVCEFQVYDLTTTTWVAIETYGDGDPYPALPTSDSSSYDATSELSSLFSFASDKQAWVNALAFRWLTTLAKGADGNIISTKGARVTIDYTPPSGPSIPVVMHHRKMIGVS